MIPEIKLEYGVFSTATEACAAAEKAQKDYVKNFTLNDRKRFIQAIRDAYMANVDAISNLEYEETGYGRPDDKRTKNIGTILAVPGVEYLPSNMFFGNDGLTVEYYAPFGVVGAVTPVTNPTATVCGNGVANLAAGNSVVFNPHPDAKVSTCFALQIINKAIVGCGGPNNMLCCCKNPSLDSLDEIMAFPSVTLLIGTGGPGMVKTLMSSGKKVIAAGPGNPPSIIDDDINCADAAKGIISSSAFENNLMCIAEKEVFVLDSIFDEFVQELQKAGAKVLTRDEGKIMNSRCVLPKPNGNGYATNKDFVGRNTNFILHSCGIKCEGDPRIAVFEADNDDPLVQTEQMMPILPLVRCKNFEEAMERAYRAEHNCKHSATIWSNNSRHVTDFGKLINTTVFVQNGPTLAAFGQGGSGTSAPTIATPTGEGPTGPWSFVRKRRFAMAGGLNYLL